MSNIVIEVKAPEITATLEKLISVLTASTVISSVSKPAPQEQAARQAITPASIPVPVQAAPTMPTAPMAPVTPCPPGPMQGNQTMGADNMPSAPAPLQPVPATLSTNPSAQVPTGAAPTYTLEQLQAAISPLLMQGKGPQLQELLKKYGMQRLPDISADKLGAFATDLRGMGAQI